jgi:hypothetical protein
MSDHNYTETDWKRGREVAHSQNWISNRGALLRDRIAKAIAEERAVMRTEMLGRVARTDIEIEKFVATIKRIWNIK